MLEVTKNSLGWLLLALSTGSTFTVNSMLDSLSTVKRGTVKEPICLGYKLIVQVTVRDIEPLIICVDWLNEG
jgi:hypothetical protein